MIARPVASSRLPVGSSAISSEGRGAKRPRQRDALLLAARKLGGIVALPLGEADQRQFLARRARRRRGAPASSSGAATFSSAVIVGMR